MAKINSRAKGSAGEREFCEWLFKNFADVKEKPKRNLTQTREGGADVLVPPFAYEVKRVESPNQHAWWLQVKAAVTNPKDESFGLIPVVAFRQNNKPWRFLIPATYIGVDSGYMEIKESVFKRWAQKIYESYQQILSN